jgi:hypothetical protein
LLLQSCGGGGSSYSGPAAPPQPANNCGASGADIAGNHGHVLVIASADLDSMVNKSYSIAGTAGHDHTVTFTPTQLAQLKAHTAVAVTSTSTLGHEHVVTANCI